MNDTKAYKAFFEALTVMVEHDDPVQQRLRKAAPRLKYLVREQFPNHETWEAHKKLRALTAKVDTMNPADAVEASRELLTLFGEIALATQAE